MQFMFRRRLSDQLTTEVVVYLDVFSQLLLQGGVYYAVALRPEKTPAALPLSTFPAQIRSSWQMAQEYPVEKEVQEVQKESDP